MSILSISTAVFLIVLLVLIICFSIYVVYSNNTQSNNSGSAPSCPASMSNNNCIFANESYFDSTILNPQNAKSVYNSDGIVMYLGDFINNKDTQMLPPCQPTWYAFRYVRLNDGGYGPLSVWNGPVYSGAPQLPCYPLSGTSGNNLTCGGTLIQTGSSSCQFNQPTLITMDTLQYDTYSGDYIANVHRYIGTSLTDIPTPEDEGTIIGNLLQIPTNQVGWTSFWVDVTCSQANTNFENSCC
jgi:hypothetical protein